MSNIIPLNIVPVLVPPEGVEEQGDELNPFAAVFSLYFMRRDQKTQAYHAPANILISGSSLEEVKEKMIAVIEEEYAGCVKEAENGPSNLSS